MERNEQRIGLINLVMFLILGVLAFAVARYAQTEAGQTASLFIGLGFLVAAVSWFQMRLEEQERLEKLEFDELKRSAASGTLFERTPDAETFPAQRSRQQFERFFVPTFTAILCLLQAAGAWWSWRMLKTAEVHAVRHPLSVLGVFGFIFLIAILFGVYSSSAAQHGKIRLLRPGAGYMLLSAWLSLLVLAGVVAVWSGFSKVDFYVAWFLTIVLGIVAVETLVNLILEIYRPRVRGRVARPLYESRLVGLLSTPGGLVTTAAQALDYQFGFRVSDTWFYKFLEQRLVWLILLQLGVLFVSTCVVFIQPEEEATIERFGKLVESRPILEAGPHFKLPWPIDTVHRFRSHELQSLNIGYQPDPNLMKDHVMVWTKPHYREEFNLLVASSDTISTSTNLAGERVAPVNMLTVGIPMQYRITNIVDWAYEHADTSNLLSQIATREVVRYLASVDLFNVMSVGQGEGAKLLQQKIQALANQYSLGVEIVYIGLQDIHPPTKVADAFEKVVSAQQDMLTNIVRAEGESSRTTLLAQAESIKQVRTAEAAATNRVAVYTAMADQFTNQMAAYNASPQVYALDTYLNALVKSGGRARKFIVAPTNTSDVIQLNLESRVRNDLSDITVPPPK